MSLIAAIIVAVALAVGAPVPAPAVQPIAAPTVEHDAWASLAARGVPPVEQGGGCTPEHVRYIDSGEHGTTKVGQFSIWSTTNPELFHHFVCK